MTNVLYLGLTTVLIISNAMKIGKASNDDDPPMAAMLSVLVGLAIGALTIKNLNLF